MLPQPHLLPQVSLKGYRELLKRLRQQSNDESSTSGALFQQAKELALAHLRRKRGSEKIDPRRAFSRLRQRVLDKKLELKQLKDAKKEKLKATYTALREQRQSRREARAEELLVLGSNSLSRTVILGAVGLLSRGFMTMLNSTKVQGQEHIATALKRPSGQGLITVSNHTAALDDPLLLAAMMPLESFSKPSAFRWGLCATDRCFKNGLLTTFFRAGKTLPVERGAGLDQPGIRAAEARLSAGDWVHIFPEGTRSADGRLGSMRMGVGHLIASCSSPPIVLPFVHKGMDKVLPRGGSIPQTGQEVQMLVGEPLDFCDLHARSKAEHWSKREYNLAITQRVAEALRTLKARLDESSVAEALAGESLASTDDSAALMPLIEEQMDGLQHSWTQKSCLQKAFCQSWPTFPEQEAHGNDTAKMLQGSDFPVDAVPSRHQRNFLQPVPSLHQLLQRAKRSMDKQAHLRAVLEHFSGRGGMLQELAFC